MLTMRNTYPHVEGGRFDEEYFVSRHVPLAQEILSPEAIGVRVLKPVALPGQALAARMIVEFDFPSREAMGRAVASRRMAELAADVANYTDTRGTVTLLESGD